MCRLLAYACSEPHSVEELLGPQMFEEYRALSHLHRDGWGMSWLEAGVPIIERSTVPAYEDPEFERLARRRLSTAGLVHLRWATVGIEVAPENTHPFLAGRWAFAHQGAIQSLHLMEEWLTPAWRGRLGGSTDSERYFLYLLQCIDEEGELVAGIRRAVGDIAGSCGPASLNAVLLSPESLVFVHGRTDLEPPLDELVTAVGSLDNAPHEHVDHYFRIRYRRIGDDVVVTSSGLPNGDWEEVPPNTILRVDLASRAMSLHSFEGEPAEHGG